jgi:hypothetical protein
VHKFNWSQCVTFGNERAKRSWHATGRSRLRELAKLLDLPIGSYDIRSNMAGVAVSGEVTLHSEDIYVRAGQSVMGDDHGILIRQCRGRKDYTGGNNNFHSLELLNNLPYLAKLVQGIRSIGKA